MKKTYRITEIHEYGETYFWAEEQLRAGWCPAWLADEPAPHRFTSIESAQAYIKYVEGGAKPVLIHHNLDENFNVIN